MSISTVLRRLALSLPALAIAAAGLTAAVRRWAGRGAKALLLLVAAFALYVLLLLNPGPLFAYEARFANVVLHAPQPLPDHAIQIARAAHDRIARSPFFSATDEYDVYLCDTPGLYAFVSLKPGTGGVSQVYLDGNVFLRPSAIERDRLIGPSGKDVPGDRTLTYYIAHELAHTMVARPSGAVRTTRSRPGSKKATPTTSARRERSTSTRCGPHSAPESASWIPSVQGCISATICSRHTRSSGRGSRRRS
jgi:hypothetical protein